MLTKQETASTPFDKARQNLNTFADNYMILWTCWTACETLKKMESVESNPMNEMAVSLAEETLKQLFKYTLSRDNGIWN